MTDHPESWERLKVIFGAALERPPADRAAFLRDACGSDHTLRTELESLLAAHAAAGDFVQQPAILGLESSALAPLEAAARVPDDRLLEGRQFSHFRIIEKLGAGGMGIVYKAEDTQLGRYAALKFLTAHYAGQHQAVERFRREARAASALNHPNICTIYHVSEHEGHPFIVMEYLDGQTLRRRIDGRPLPIDVVVRLGAQVADALSAAHGAGIVHRDITPANIFITVRGDAKVLDFGLAKVALRPNVEETGTRGGPDVDPLGQNRAVDDRAAPPAFRPRTIDSVATRMGAVIGTRNYMSPEQARGEQTDDRTDIYSLGVVLFEMTTGRRPFGGMSRAEALARIREGRAPTIREVNPGVPADLVSIIEKCLEGAREERYQSAQDLRDRLIEVQRRLLRRRLENDAPRRVRDSGDARMEIEEALPAAAIGTSSASDRAIPSLAVLPFVNESRDLRLNDIAVARRQIDDARTHMSGRRSAIRLFRPAAAMTAGLAITSAVWWYSWTSDPSIQPGSVPGPHEPVSIVIADVENRTNEAAFDRTLEPMLRRALDEAGFIIPFDRARIPGALEEPPPDKFDEVAARTLAVRQGLGVLLASSVDHQGSGYGISIKATETVSGNVIANPTALAPDKDHVLSVAIALITTVRQALGDHRSEPDQLSGLASLLGTSLDLARLYAATELAMSNRKYEEARQSALEAVALDPNFGIGYAQLGMASVAMGRFEDREKYLNQALSYPEGMTERERLETRGLYYRLLGNFQQCANIYGAITARYTAAVAAHNQRAICFSKLGNLRETTNELRRAVQILPNRLLYRFNLAAFSAYAGDFQTAEREARTIPEGNVLATVTLAFAQVGQGQLREAMETYSKLATINRRGASMASSGLANLALYEGRVSDAVRLFEQGAAADLESKAFVSAAKKLTSLASVHLLRGETALATDTAEKALRVSSDPNVQFLAARIFVDAGAVARARTLAAGLTFGERTDAKAYARIIEGEIALKNGDHREAIRILSEANATVDTWLGHLDLGRAYLEVNAIALADAEFDLCLKRRGEALSLMMDDEPTFGFFPAVFQGRRPR